MTDRELLELAAKAAGYGHFEYVEYYDHEYAAEMRGLRFEGRHGLPWNPLEDDGDALRLAVKLGLKIDTNCYGTTVSGKMLGAAFAENHGTYPYSATRRAIVRASAEIGRAMESAE